MNSESLQNKNVIFITLDSCRFDTAEKAHIPNIRSIGALRKAYTHGSYTVPAHVAFFAGHLPAVLDEPLLTYYSESVNQLWRIKTGPAREKPAGLLLEGKDLLEGYRKLGFYILGVGGVTQFNHGSQLRSYFDNDFLYYGFDLDQEPLNLRKKENFPLNHINEIVDKMQNKDKWLLFINCPETHYPYDIGENISSDVLRWFPKLKKHLNLRETKKDIDLPESISQTLHLMQIKALEEIDKSIGQLLQIIPKNRELLIIVCGDHGENFGEEFIGRKRWGHMIPSPKVLEVPLVIGMVK